ncbi:LytR C-terminal domain-containing protein [Actinoplanes sp. RD1]|uniref:LytR C-terminal domain-containing protein n=1 Tax=Actinoplanes sp. RD1 TaxID=3064538 RepID=UPI00274085E3|nr:LytR C-terminal domain-containing protein [Actinoplanes sp. RD1]
MSLSDQLRALEDDVAQLPVAPAADIRARGRRRGRTQLTATVVAVAAAATTAGVVATLHGPAPQPAAAPPSRAAVPIECVVTLPTSPDQVRVRVSDTGAATALRERGFTVLSGPGDTGPAVLRYGPEAIGDAALLRAYLPGVTPVYDPGRAGDTMDLTVGPAFTGLATTTEVNQALVEAGAPTPPPGC